MGETMEELKEKFEKLAEREAELIELVGNDAGFDSDVVQYVRLTIRDTRDGYAGTQPAVSGIQLIQADNNLAELIDAWCNTYTSSVPMKIIDGNPATSWRDERMRPVVLELKEPAKLMGYRMMTSSANPEADPKHWILEGSAEKDAAWHVLHEMKEDANLPKDRSSWSIMIPIVDEDDSLVKLIQEGDKFEQEGRYSQIDKRKSMEISRLGPTREEVFGLRRTMQSQKDANRIDGSIERSRGRELEAMKKKTKELEKKTAKFLEIVLRKVSDLLMGVEDYKERSAHAETIDENACLDLIEEIELDRENEVQHIQTVTSNSKQDDSQLTQSLTSLQNRCLVELPAIHDKGEATKHALITTCNREINDLEDVYRHLEHKNRELSFHTKRGTNFKQPIKTQKQAKDEMMDDSKETLKVVEDTKRRIDEGAEIKSEIHRLRRLKVDMTSKHKKMEKDYAIELAKIRRVFNEIHKERSLLGQERCELEAICADFSGVIEKLQAQLPVNHPFAKPTVAGPISTKFTIGHGRLSPRPMTSPRRSVTPQPRSRATTPRVTPRRHH